MALIRQSLDSLIDAMKRFGEYEKQPAVTFEPYEDAVAAVEPAEIVTFASPITQDAFEALTEPLPPAQYECLVRVAVPTSEDESIEARVQDVLSAG